ncbi:MAG: hypothetical protein LOY03_10630 [Cyclobacteriaceae bacterium]|jgi:hypothetical protein|nr:hypothetical protein [Cyclobacteriaceae bacterium]
MAARIPNTLAVVAYLVAVSVLLAFCYARPSYNWDMLAYAAVVLDDGEVSPEALHAEVYSIASEEIPAEAYSMLVDTSHPLRKEVLESPERFYQFLSFFRIKPLYTGMCSAFHALGVPLMKATVFPSTISIFLLSLLLFFRFSRTVPFWVAGVLGLSVICAPPVIEAARLSTPDALSTLILVGALVLYLQRAQAFWYLLLLAVAVLVRLDNVIPATVLLFLLIVRESREEEHKGIILPAACLLVLFFAYSYLILRYAEYNHGFNEFYGGLAGKWKVLVSDAVRGLKTLQTSYVAIGGISFVVLFYRNGFRLSGLNRNQLVFVAATIAFLARYVLFPDLTTRFFLWYYILCWIFIVEGIVGSGQRPSLEER